MKRLFVITAAVCLWALAARAELATGIGVVVNDSVITYSEIEQGVERSAQTAAQIYAHNPSAFNQQIEKLRNQEVERLVEDKLILHEFATAGYATNVVEAFIDDEIRRDIQRDYNGDRSLLIKTLQAKGMTYETFRNQQREQIIIRIMNYQNSSNPKKILISPLKIEQYYAEHKDEFKVDDQIHLCMIAVKPEGGNTNSTHELAAEILAKIDSGVPFEEMADEVAAIYGMKRLEGGDRGWVDRDYFKPELSKPAFALKPGQHTGIIDLPEASYILMVKEARPAHVRALSEVRGEIERALLVKENARLRDHWIERLKRKQYVRYY